MNYEEFKKDVKGLPHNIVLAFAIQRLIEKRSEEYLESSEFTEIFDSKAEKLINGKNESLMRKLLIMEERILAIESILEKGSIYEDKDEI